MKCTHYKALMKKNWINWKRTLCGSLAEIACPLVLIGMLVSLKGLFQAETIPASVLYQNASLQVPLRIKRNDDGLEENMSQLGDFNDPLMSFAGKRELFTQRGGCDRRYDTGNPCREWQEEGLKQQILGMSYEHCYDSDRDGRLDSTVVGLIHDGNDVGKQMESEVKRLSRYQKQVYDQKMKKFAKDNGGNMDPSKMTAEQRTKMKALGRKPLDFEVRNFISKQEMFDFIQAPDYRSPTVAGLCFAVQVDELPVNKGYNIEIFMNDQLAEGPF